MVATLSPVVHVTKYGRYEVGRPYRDGVSWFRKDRWFPHPGHEEHANDLTLGVVERYFAAGADDQTPALSIYGNYDARCECCWLGFGHTEALHEERVRRERYVAGGTCGASGLGW